MIATRSVLGQEFVCVNLRNFLAQYFHAVVGSPLDCVSFTPCRIGREIALSKA